MSTNTSMNANYLKYLFRMYFNICISWYVPCNTLHSIYVIHAPRLRMYHRMGFWIESRVWMKICVCLNHCLKIDFRVCPELLQMRGQFLTQLLRLQVSIPTKTCAFICICIRTSMHFKCNFCTVCLKYIPHFTGPRFNLLGAIRSHRGEVDSVAMTTGHIRTLVGATRNISENLVTQSSASPNTSILSVDSSGLYITQLYKNLRCPSICCQSVCQNHVTPKKQGDAKSHHTLHTWRYCKPAQMQLNPSQVKLSIDIKCGIGNIKVIVYYF